MTHFADMVKIWRSNATCVGENIPVGLLQAQLLDAANTVELLEKENDQLVELGGLLKEKHDRLVQGVYNIATGKDA